jgi:hypothetical protein
MLLVILIFQYGSMHAIGVIQNVQGPLMMPTVGFPVQALSLSAKSMGNNRTNTTHLPQDQGSNNVSTMIIFTSQVQIC